MQGELNAMSPPVPIRIFGVNQMGQESGNESITTMRTLPWLQEPMGMDVWGSWGVTYRDVVILDTRNVTIEVYNLTVHDLADPTNYADLRARLMAASRR